MINSITNKDIDASASTAIDFTRINTNAYDIIALSPSRPEIMSPFVFQMIILWTFELFFEKKIRAFLNIFFPLFITSFKNLSPQAV